MVVSTDLEHSFAVKKHCTQSLSCMCGCTFTMLLNSIIETCIYNKNDKNCKSFRKLKKKVSHDTNAKYILTCMCIIDFESRTVK